MNNEKIEKSLIDIKNHIDKLESKINDLKNFEKVRADEFKEDIHHLEQEIHEEEVQLNLTRNEFLSRVKEVGMENFKIVYSFIKVISLTTATIVLLNLLLSSHLYFALDIWNHLDLETICSLTLWYVAFILLLLTYDAAIFGNIYFFKLPPIWVTKFTFSFIVFEFLLFAILKPNFFLEKETADTNNILKMLSPTTIWFSIHGIYSIAISFFCNKCVHFLNENKSQLRNNSLIKSWDSYTEDIITEKNESRQAGAISLIIFFISVVLSVIIFNLHLDSNHILSKSNIILKILAGLILIKEISKSYRKQFIKRDKVLNKLNEN